MAGKWEVVKGNWEWEAEGFERGGKMVGKWELLEASVIWELETGSSWSWEQGNGN